MKHSNSTSPALIAVIVFIGVIAVSTGAILVRLAIAKAGVESIGFSLVMSASRLSFAALLLVPSWQKINWRSHQHSAFFYAALAGIFLALHFATWITSLSYTSIAASTTLVTTSPVWVAILSAIWLNEKPSKLTIFGIMIALAGGTIIGLGEGNINSTSSNPILGNSLAIIGAWAISLYLIFGREAQQRGLTIGGYIAVAYTVAALTLLPLPFFFGTGYGGYPNLVYFYLILMGILPQLVGHTSFSWAVNRTSPTLVMLAILFEPVGASILGYIFFQEIPSVTVIIGAIVILTGVAIALLGAKSNTV
ncbi:MAG: DMT family transporter [Cyanobacteriota bacterium]|nr:DMT family transporter [Cyanobacteriota bacterium]